MSRAAKCAGSRDTWRAERAIVLQLLRDDRQERWSVVELANEIGDFEVVLVDRALGRLEQAQVLRRAGGEVCASRAARRLDELELIAI